MFYSKTQNLKKKNKQREKLKGEFIHLFTFIQPGSSTEITSLAKVAVIYSKSIKYNIKCKICNKLTTHQ